MTYYPKVTSLRISKGYGYEAGGQLEGFTNSAIVEKYDDVADTWATKQSLDTARYYLSGFSLNGYGYAAGGTSNKVENYDDIANTWTNKTILNATRDALAGFSLHGYGYTAGGYIAAVSAVTEKYDDVANTWTAKASMNTARDGLRGFLLHGYGYTAGGYIAAVSAVTEKYDDTNNTWTSKANMNSATNRASGFSLNGYGYTATGRGNNAARNWVEKYDDILNTWTTKTGTNTGKQGIPAGFSIGSLRQSIQNPDIQEIVKHSNKELIPVDQTASRAIDGTAYTNTASSNLFVTVSARCYIDGNAKVANIQAFSDTNADPATAVSGIAEIEGGLAGEDVSVEISFIVRPYEKYKVEQTISAGCTATLGKWFETIMK